MSKRILVAGVIAALAVTFAPPAAAAAPYYQYPFQDPRLPLQVRVDDLTRRLTGRGRSAGARRGPPRPVPGVRGPPSARRLRFALGVLKGAAAARIERSGPWRDCPAR